MNIIADATRREEIAQALGLVNEEVTAACSAAGRKPDEVRLVAVTKNFPASDVLHLASLGLVDIGENRDQEAAAKAAEVAESAAVRWHFVGRLQRNKAKSVASYAHMVQSVDRKSLVSALSTGAARLDRRLATLVQISLDGDTERGGVAAEDLPGLVDSILDAPSLSLNGVMAVAPLGWEPARAFDALAGLSEQVKQHAPQAREISAGMSGDFAEAIACGATMIRLGSKLLGRRRNVGYPVR